jgi:hypothetical protein
MILAILAVCAMIFFQNLQLIYKHEVTKCHHPSFLGIQTSYHKISSLNETSEYGTDILVIPTTCELWLVELPSRSSCNSKLLKKIEWKSVPTAACPAYLDSFVPRLNALFFPSFEALLTPHKSSTDPRWMAEHCQRLVLPPRTTIQDCHEMPLV